MQTEQDILVGVLHGLNQPNFDNCFSAMKKLVVAIETAGIPASYFSAQEINKLRGIDSSDTFYHSFAVVGEFLVDTTFMQFTLVGSEVIEGNSFTKTFNSSISPFHPLIKALLHDGYIKLTEETLNIYLDAITNKDAHPSQPLSVQGLQNVPSLIVRDSERIIVLDEIQKYYRFDPRVLRR